MIQLLGRPIPPKPAVFDAEHAPDGVEVRFVTFWQGRPALRSPLRSALVHTNGAEREGSVTSAWNWAHAEPNSNTLPHYQVDRRHDGVWVRKMLPTDRRAIGNATVDAHQDGHDDISWWSMVIETADLGWPTANRPDAPGGACGFETEQGDMVATILAYESIVSPALTLTKLTEWFGAGVGGHTDPFGYPYTTLHPGKPCPGPAKKAEIWAQVLPRAIEIRAAWLGQSNPTVIPSEEDYLTMPAIAAIYKPNDTVTAAKGGPYKASWFVLQASGDVRRATGPDVAFATAVKAPTYPIEGLDHYDELARRAV